MSWLSSKQGIQGVERTHGLRLSIIDGTCSQIMAVLFGGAFLVQYALLMGASNFVIGAIAAIGPVCQLLQIPAIYIIDRTRSRKATTVLTAGAGRIFLVLAAAAPWLASGRAAMGIFLFGLIMYNALGAIAGCAWTSWMRDFVPQRVMGSYFARRMAVATAAGAALSLLAAFGLDHCKDRLADPKIAYAAILGVGVLFGILGAAVLSRIPEPAMDTGKSQGLLALLAEPLRDANFRRLIVFLGSWNFAINLAAPFFTVYLLRRLEMSMAWVIGLTVLSQAANVVFLRVWGRLADKYTNKPVLGVSGFLFLISIVLWPFTLLPERHFLTIPLVVMIHVLAGMATAGVAISAGNIALKLAPYGRATSYLALNGVVSGVAATIAPLLAGAVADWFADKQMQLTISWTSATHHLNLPAVHLQGFDFLFVAAFFLGLGSLQWLVAVREQGEVEEDIVVTELLADMRQKIKHISTVGGLRYLTYFPYQRLRDMLSHFGSPRTQGPAASR
jgi:MFS family permease